MANDVNKYTRSTPEGLENHAKIVAAIEAAGGLGNYTAQLVQRDPGLGLRIERNDQAAKRFAQSLAAPANV